jgi:DNA repair protein RecN (Recombination protein N)
MLSHLYIENYALIEKLEIDFTSGFSVITGETGAGKSIIIGAISLILGQRADVSILFNKTKKCVIEGSFDISQLELKEFFINNELDEDNPCILRREILTNGKSRAFINDTPVNLGQLKEIGEKLVDIHSQHNTLTLNNSDFQMSVTDTIAGNQELLKKYNIEFIKYQKLKQELIQLKEKEKEANTQKDYLQFIFDELEKANFQTDEQEKVTIELELQNNAEEIKTGLFKSISILSQSEINAISLLNEVGNQFNKLKEYHPKIKEINIRMQSCIIELKDIVTETEAIEESIHFDNEKIDFLTQRLDLIYRIEKKHSVNTIFELLEIKDRISKELLQISSYEEKIVSLEKEVGQQHKIISDIADSISNQRENIIPGIENKVKVILNELGMSTAELKINLTKNQQLTIKGCNTIEFLFNANKGGELRELSKVISGGELSRLMLAIKSIISKQKILPTVIFDEIDNGVSGDIAAKVGTIMRKMASNRQLIAITHLPQIAAKAEDHYFVSKKSNDEFTSSIIKKLSKDEKIEEIAKMLSNEKVTASALENARQLMN